jgi:hypothetical protein
MAEGAQKSAGKAQTASAERRPMRRAVASPEVATAVEALYTLQRQAGNRAVTQGLSGGVPLAQDVRKEMELRFGTDFSAVRIHDDDRAHASAALMDAKAYTHGRDIVFGANRLNSQAGGKQVLAHELAHVVQQRRGGASPALDAQAPHERDATQAARAFAGGREAIGVVASTGIGVARDADDDSWSARMHRRVAALKEQIPEKYRAPLAKTLDVVADATVSAVLTPIAPPFVTDGLGSALLHSAESAATGEKGGSEDIKGFARKKAQQGVGAAKAVATQVTEIVDTGLWLGGEYKNARDKAAGAIGGKEGSVGNTLVKGAIDTTAQLLPGFGGLPAAADAGDRLKAAGLVDKDTNEASLTAPLSEKLNQAVAWTEEHIGGTPSDPELFTEAEKAELATNLAVQVGLSFTGAEEVKVAMNVVGALEGLRGIVESVRHEKDWKTSSRFWSNVIGLVLSVVGLKHTMAATKITTLMLKFGWVAAAIPPLVQMAADYVNPDLAERADLSPEENKQRRTELDRRMKQNWTQVVHVLKDAVLHVAQSAGGKSAAKPGGGGSEDNSSLSAPTKTQPPTDSAAKKGSAGEPLNGGRPADEGNVTSIKSGAARAKSQASKDLDNALAKQAPDKAGSVTQLRPKSGSPPSEPQQQVQAAQQEPQKLAVGQTHGAGGGAAKSSRLRAVPDNETAVAAQSGATAPKRGSRATAGGTGRTTEADAGSTGRRTSVDARESTGKSPGTRSAKPKGAGAKGTPRKGAGGKKPPPAPTGKAGGGGNQEPLVAVRVQGGGAKRKGSYWEAGTPEFERAAANKRFTVLPKSQADALGFRPAGTAHDTSIDPLRINGVQVESNGAGGGKGNKHNITARAESQADPKTANNTFGKTIQATLAEAHGYKHLLASGERGIIRAGNVSTGGVDAITARVEGSKTKIFLNDFTGPGTSKGAKATHQDWLGEARAAIKAKSFGFGDEATDTAIKNALQNREVYVRTVRVEYTPQGVNVTVGPPVKVK